MGIIQCWECDPERKNHSGLLHEKVGEVIDEFVEGTQSLRNPLQAWRWSECGECLEHKDIYGDVDADFEANSVLRDPLHTLEHVCEKSWACKHDLLAIMTLVEERRQKFGRGKPQ